MMPEYPSVITEIQTVLRSHTGLDAELRSVGKVQNHQINRSMRVEFGEKPYFVKLNSAKRRQMFEAEMTGLLEIAATRTIRVPEPVACGDDGSSAFLVMEHLDLIAGGDPSKLGENLAAMHFHTRDRFGWIRDNTIGSTPQVNTLEDDWVGFWHKHRLLFQLELADRNGFGGQLQKRGEMLLADIGKFFISYRPEPALLHGDLWSGNHAYLPVGEPVIFDPAVYYGDRETDLAMTELFGGFGPGFYAAYHGAYPLDEGYAVRKHLYQLYHVLNHLNLFGAGYLGQAEALIHRLASELY